MMSISSKTKEKILEIRFSMIQNRRGQEESHRRRRLA